MLLQSQRMFLNSLAVAGLFLCCSAPTTCLPATSAQPRLKQRKLLFSSSSSSSLARSYELCSLSALRWGGVFFFFNYNKLLVSFYLSLFFSFSLYLCLFLNCFTNETKKPKERTPVSWVSYCDSAGMPKISGNMSFLTLNISIGRENEPSSALQWYQNPLLLLLLNGHAAKVPTQ